MTANTIIYHSHHIFPRHIDSKGIFDDYRIKVTVEEHAEIHGLLFDEYWRKKDFIAWRQLSGQISVAQAIKETQKLPRIFSSEHRLKLSLAKRGSKNMWYGTKGPMNGKQGSMLGRKHTLESRKNNSIAQKKRFEIEINPFKGKTHSLETRQKISYKVKKSFQDNPRKPCTEETKKKISLALKGNKNFQGHIPWNKGKKKV